mmetsp:Transcript_30628/g.99062  ORF Transcript_30628/g.99062 Transcript_30628/m.99062 type:complete len:263 (+) Transcript_30628:763-1551(+)
MGGCLGRCRVRYVGLPRRCPRRFLPETRRGIVVRSWDCHHPLFGDIRMRGLLRPHRVCLQAPLGCARLGHGRPRAAVRVADWHPRFCVPPDAPRVLRLRHRARRHRHPDTHHARRTKARRWGDHRSLAWRSERSAADPRSHPQNYFGRDEPQRGLGRPQRRLGRQRPQRRPPFASTRLRGNVNCTQNRYQKHKPCEAATRNHRSSAAVRNSSVEHKRSSSKPVEWAVLRRHTGILLRTGTGARAQLPLPCHKSIHGFTGKYE